MDAARDIDVSDDCVLLSRILDEHELTVRWLATRIGRSPSQVYKYLAGEATIPSVAWRAVYERTRDQRIVGLFVGEAPVIVAPLPTADAGMIMHPSDLRGLIKMRQTQIRTETSLLEIIEDGKIDRKDRAAIERYRESYDVMMATQAAIKGRIETEYGKAVRA